jgi:carbonic anhydrase/acetyltransferase-like protein (isoleucine patch superfamily)
MPRKHFSLSPLGRGWGEGRSMIHAHRGVVPKGSLLMGAPARVKRSVTEKDLELIYRSAKGYIGLATEYRAARGA